MGDEPKSAFEIAMEKLRRKDKASGKAPPRKLSDEQKEQIREARGFWESKLAEREILYRDELKKAGHDAEKIAEVEAAYKEDRRKMEAERDERIARIRG